MPDVPLSPDNWKKFSQGLQGESGGGQADSNAGVMSGVGRGLAGLGYGAVEALDAPSRYLSGGAVAPLSKAQAQFPSWKEYATGPSANQTEAISREATQIVAPGLIPGPGEIDLGVQGGAALARYGGPAVRWAIEKGAKYGPAALKGMIGGAIQPTESGAQGKQAEAGTGAAVGAKMMRDYLSTPAGRALMHGPLRYLLPSLALAYAAQNRGKGGESPWEMSHLAYYLGPLAALAAMYFGKAPGAVGAAAGQTMQKLDPAGYSVTPADGSQDEIAPGQ